MLADESASSSLLKSLFSISMPGESNPIPRVGTNVSLSNSVLSAILSKSIRSSTPLRDLGLKASSVGTGTGMKLVGEPSSVPTNTPTQDKVVTETDCSVTTGDESTVAMGNGTVVMGDGMVAVGDGVVDVGNGKAAVGDATGGSEGGPVETVAPKSPEVSSSDGSTSATMMSSGVSSNTAETITANKRLVKVHCRYSYSVFSKLINLPSPPSSPQPHLCTVCFKSSSNNKLGKPEQMLICSNCTASGKLRTSVCRLS